MEMAADLRTAYEHCRRVTREQAKNFYYAFVTLPPAKRRAIYAAYAFCRLCDDIADEPLSTEAKVHRLAEARARLGDAYGGRPDGPVFAALWDAAQAYHIPQEYFQEVVRGVEMDLTQSRYRTFDDLHTYCYRVASAVGLICVTIFQYRDPRARDYAVDLGIAMQLTNILRDIREDAQRGRIYLPQEEIERFRCSEDELCRGIINDSFVQLMRFQVERARRYFASGKRLLPLLSRRSRACPAVLHGLYSRVLDKIEARGYNVFAERVRLSTGEKLLLTASLWVRSLFLRSGAESRAT